MARRGGVEKRSVENSSTCKERSIKGNGKKRRESVCRKFKREKEERKERGRREKEEEKRRENFVSTKPSQLRERLQIWIEKQARRLTLVSFP